MLGLLAFERMWFSSQAKIRSFVGFGHNMWQFNCWTLFAILESGSRQCWIWLPRHSLVFPINRFSISPPINVCRLNPSLPTLLNPNIFPKNSFPTPPCSENHFMSMSPYSATPKIHLLSTCFLGPSYSPIKKVFCLTPAHLYSASLKGDICSPLLLFAQMQNAEYPT